MNPFSGLLKLFRSSTFAAGALANVAAYALGGVLDWRILLGSVAAYGVRSAGEHIGARLPAPPQPVPSPEFPSDPLTVPRRTT